jgi:hypothetical protein
MKNALPGCGYRTLILLPAILRILTWSGLIIIAFAGVVGTIESSPCPHLATTLQFQSSSTEAISAEKCGLVHEDTSRLHLELSVVRRGLTRVSGGVLAVFPLGYGAFKP